MCRSLARLAACCALLSASSARAAQKPAPPDIGIPVARLAFADDLVEREASGGWERITEGARVRTGDRIRTGPGTTARIAFPFMSLLVGPSTTLSIPPSPVLSTVLEEGRVEQRAVGGGQLMKLKTAEALVRGNGWVVVRRTGEGTGVVVFQGRIRVEGSGKSLTVQQGHGSVVASGRPPSAPEALPAAPGGLSPGGDPVYVKRGEAVTLTWRAAGASHHVQVLPIEGDEVLIDRDVGNAPASVAIPWPGTFRWRVSVRDQRGLEGLPSAFGFICVVDKLGDGDGHPPSSLPSASSTSARTASTGSESDRRSTGTARRAAGPIRPSALAAWALTNSWASESATASAGTAAAASGPILPSARAAFQRRSPSGSWRPRTRAGTASRAAAPILPSAVAAPARL